MTSYDQALSARDGAIKLLEAFGVTVLRVKPTKKKTKWYVEAETARPLPRGHGKLEADGVEILVVDQRLKPRP